MPKRKLNQWERLMVAGLAEVDPRTIDRIYAGERVGHGEKKGIALYRQVRFAVMRLVDVAPDLPLPPTKWRDK